jgi:hypothetical protein
MPSEEERRSVFNLSYIRNSILKFSNSSPVIQEKSATMKFPHSPQGPVAGEFSEQSHRKINAQLGLLGQTMLSRNLN